MRTMTRIPGIRRRKPADSKADRPKGAVFFAYASRSAWIKLAEQLIIISVVIVSFAPIWVALVTSFQTPGELSGGGVIPGSDPTYENYARAWNDLRFNRMFGNSAIFALTSALFSTILAAGAAFGLVRYRFRGRGLMLVGLIGGIAVPPIVVIIPIFLTMTSLGWINQFHSAIIAEIGLLLPFSIFLLYSYMKDLPQELFDAAAVDGAGSLRQFWHVALPLSTPGLLTTAVIAAIFAWNELLVPLILWQVDRLQTLMVGLATLGPGRTGVRDVPLLMAGVMITIIPLVVLFIFVRRALIRGLTEGALK